MADFNIDVLGSGAIALGEAVCCDGFVESRAVRVQSHVHYDHMAGFESSKGNQKILCSSATRELLVAQYDADLPYRSNLVGLSLPARAELEECGDSVELTSSGHMLGAVQVVVETAGGHRLGYSGDFQWPNQPIQVDALVVDSTYGSPSKLRHYNQAEADAALLELVQKRLQYGGVSIQAFRGTLHRALRVLTDEVNSPLVVTAELASELEVYIRNGYQVDYVEESEVDESTCPVIRFFGTGDQKPVDPYPTSIKLSTFQTSPDHPVRTYGEGNYSVALCDHADFEGTLEYIAATNASFVLTDNSRGYGVELAQAIQGELGVEACWSQAQETKSWGQG